MRHWYAAIFVWCAMSTIRDILILGLGIIGGLSACIALRPGKPKKRPQLTERGAGLLNEFVSSRDVWILTGAGVWRKWSTEKQAWKD